MRPDLTALIGTPDGGVACIEFGVTQQRVVTNPDGSRSLLVTIAATKTEVIDPEVSP